jgi:hypothetical protein
MLLPLILFLTVALPIAWFISEFQPRTWLRLVLGCAAIGMSYLVATGVGLLQQLDYNAWYGDASRQLIDTTVVKLESGKMPEVIANLNWLSRNYQPTYENRADYDDLVAEYVKRFEKH